MRRAWLFFASIVGVVIFTASGSALRPQSTSDGLPTISIPYGFTRSGLPIGMQITGARFGEAKVLALAHAYEQTTDWRTRRPRVV
jgi:Asp-tRNA(Asn)/Glu-tRNA(Gln) amidotransferase A subunit family amidase